MKIVRDGKKGNKMEILAEKAIHTMNSLTIIAIGMVVLIVLDVIIYSICREAPSDIEMLGMVIGGCFVVLFTVLGAKYSISHPVMEYKVRFVEKIDMEEFLDTYEIRDKDGSIITIRCLDPSAPSEEATN